MKMRLFLILCLALVAILGGCAHNAVVEEIFVPDVSASITPEAFSAMWGVLHSLVQGLRRGDSLLVLPITADAGNDVSGRSLLVTALDVHHRESLDQDMEDMRTKAKQDFENLQRQFQAKQGARTDLLGTFQVISEKVHSLAKGTRAVVLVQSDYIQDDAQFDFKTDPRLESPDKAKTLAADVAKQVKCDLHGVPVYLGYLESRDLAPLSRQRRQAITTFWVTFLSQQGAQVVVATDGPGSAQSFLARAMEE
jgi:predicted ATPase